MLSPTTLKVRSASWDNGVVSDDKLDKSGDGRQKKKEVEWAEAGNAGEVSDIGKTGSTGEAGNKGETGDRDETGDVSEASESDIIAESGNKQSGVRLKLGGRNQVTGENAGVDGLAGMKKNPNHLETYRVE